MWCSQVQETTPPRAQAAAGSGGQAAGVGRPGGAGAQDPAAATEHQPSGRRDGLAAGGRRRRRRARGPAPCHAQRAPRQNQGEQLPQGYVNVSSLGLPALVFRGIYTYMAWENVCWRLLGVDFRPTCRAWTCYLWDDDKEEKQRKVGGSWLSRRVQKHRVLFFVCTTTSVIRQSRRGYYKLMNSIPIPQLSWEGQIDRYSICLMTDQCFVVRVFGNLFHRTSPFKRPSLSE